MSKNICVFCSSSDLTDTMYNTLAKNLAEIITKQKNNLIFGGANVGMMRVLAENTKQLKGKAIGVIPQRIADKVSANPDIDELIITPDMYARKAKMAELADAFIAMPGGFGTLEELSEVITHKQLGYHSKPIVIINHDGFYNSLLDFFETLYHKMFSKPVYRQLYQVVSSPQEAMSYINNYKEPSFENKWFITDKNQNQ
jgi:cytokinin riboside 5'-monophosphate phosphoribohydrolase